MCRRHNAFAGFAFAGKRGAVPFASFAFGDPARRNRNCCGESARLDATRMIAFYFGRFRSFSIPKNAENV